MKSSLQVKQKKGEIFQVIFMIVLITSIAMVGLISLVLTTNINNFWDSSGLLNETAVGKQAIDKMQDTAPKTTDYAIFFMFLGMNMGIVIGAVRTNFSPTLIFLFIMLTLLAIMIAAGVVNLYQGLAQQPEVIGISDDLTFTNFVFSKYLPLVMSIICGLVMLIMYSKSGSDIIS